VLAKLRSRRAGELMRRIRMDMLVVIRRRRRLFEATADPSLRREQLGAAAKSSGTPELAVPRGIQVIAAIALLGTGKTDDVQLKNLAEGTTVCAAAA
jgi:hypothetical protein